MSCDESCSNEPRAKIFIAVVLFLIVSCAITVPVVLFSLSDPKIVLPEGALHRLACPRHRNTSKVFSYDECLRLGCEWDETSNAPSCYLPETNDYVVVNYLSKDEKGFSVHLQKVLDYSFFNEPIKDIVFHVSYINEDQLNFQILPEGRPLQHVDGSTSKINLDQAVYKVDLNDSVGSSFSFKIIRKDSDRPLWDTSIGGLIVEAQFLQIATYLPSEYVYGLGENNDTSFKRTLSYKTWPMLIRNESPGDEGLNLYGFNPFYLCIEEDGKAHGVLFNNLYISDYTLLPAPGLSVRAIGGDLSFTVIIGQSPADVYRKLSNIVGRPDMPPYWALGFHLAPFKSVQEVVNRNLEKGILLDAVHLNPDLWNHSEVFKDEAFQSLPLAEFIRQSGHLHWVVNLDPAVHADEKYPAYETGTKQATFIKWPTDILNGSLMLANLFVDCQNEKFAFPTLMTDQSQKWWKDLVQKLQKSYNLDGFLTTMNEPCLPRKSENDFQGQCNHNSCWQLRCPNNKLDYHQYRPEFSNGEFGSESNKTVCMSGVHGDGRRQLEVQTSYGMIMSAVTHQGCVGGSERCLVVTRSTSMMARTLMKSGLRDHVTKIGHWLGNSKSEWNEMQKSVIRMLESNLFGVPYVGADMCGSEGTASTDLCKAWIQLGAMYPFARMRYTKQMINESMVSIQAGKHGKHAYNTLVNVGYPPFWGSGKNKIVSNI